MRIYTSTYLFDKNDELIKFNKMQGLDIKKILTSKNNLSQIEQELLNNASIYIYWYFYENNINIGNYTLL